MTQEQEIHHLIKGMLAEAIAVAKAEGILITERDIQQILDRIARLDPKLGASMMYDRLTGLPMEHEALIGIIVQLAQKHQLPVIRNEVILALLRAVDHRPVFSPAQHE